MPIDKIFLQFFNPALKSFQTVSIVTQEKGMAVDLPVPLSSEALNELGQFEQEFRVQEKNVAFVQNENRKNDSPNKLYNYAFSSNDRFKSISKLILKK